MIAETTHTAALPMPKPTPRAGFPIAPKMRTASLWRNLPTPVSAAKPLTFEELDQSFGYVLYRTRLDEGDGGKLVLEGLHDYAQIYIDQQLVGTLDRRLDANTLELARQTRASTLDILVENTGRVNYSKAIRGERTGLTGAVTLDGKTPHDWQMYSLPMNDLSSLRWQAEPCAGPSFFQASMSVRQPADTYLDTRGLHKGQLWVGSHNLGRFWTSAGPQFTLYTPAPWLQTGTTTLTFFDLLGDASDTLRTSAEPLFGALKSTRESQ